MYFFFLFVVISSLLFFAVSRSSVYFVFCGAQFLASSEECMKNVFFFYHLQSSFVSLVVSEIFRASLGKAGSQFHDFFLALTTSFSVFFSEKFRHVNFVGKLKSFCLDEET